MKTPDLPHDEAERLESLDALEVLDTVSEERFDRITRLAKAMFNTPIALISLVDEKRQWFKSRQGLTACSTSRDISFCGHAILADEVFWVEDAQNDERFHDNPLVTGDPRIRFYAGYPLKDRNGHRLGTLCVIDQKPREVCLTGKEMLADLGKLAEGVLGSIQLGSGRVELEPRTQEERKERIDAVTGTWNRRGILEILEQGFESCKQKGWPTTVLMSGLDTSARLSETWTEMSSDTILAEAAQVLRGCIGDYDSIGRVEDERFVLLLAGLAAEEASERVAQYQAKIDANPVLRSAGVRMHFGFASTDPGDELSRVEDVLARVSESLEHARDQRRFGAAA